jgi:hypothetical protein
MSGQFRGKRLFAGRLYAGRLFGPPASSAVLGPGSPMRPPPPPRRRRRRDEDALVMVFLK